MYIHDINIFKFNYFLGDEKCPVSSFIKYFSKLNPGNDNYWQRPKLIYNETDDVWYDNVAVGKNTLGGMMAKISQVCNLSKRYTNHCIRSTCITALDDNGIETRHIMGLSGHKSESAVRAYSKRLSEKKTRQISDILSATVQETGNDESRNSCTSTNTSASTKCHVSDFKSHSTSTCTSGAAGVQQHEESNSTNLPDFLSEDYVLANVLNDITNYEAHQNSVPVQNLSQNVTNAPTCNLNNFQIPTFQGPPGTGFAISSINNSTVNFYFQSK